MPVELKPHQQEAVDKLEDGKILWGGVGVGKSFTALAYFITKVCGGVLNDPNSMRTPMDLLILTTAKKRDSLDWEKDCAKMYIGNDQASSANGIMVTVDSWNNITDYLDFKGFVIFDEQRAVGKGKWSKSFVKIASNNPWIMLSATPGDTWVDYIPIFLAHGWYENRSDFNAQHIVWKPFAKYPIIDRFTDVGKLVKMKNYLLVEMPYERHTKRHIHDLTTDPELEMGYNQELFNRVYKDRWNIYTDEPLLDIGEMFRVMRKLVNSDPSRLYAVKRLMKKHPKLIIFYNFDYELDALRTLKCEDQRIHLDRSGEYCWVSDGYSAGESGDLIGDWELCDGEHVWLDDEGSGETCVKRTDVEIAEWNGHRHQEIPTSERWVYLVQYVAGAEGWNCIETDAEILYSLTYSYKNTEQVFGRIDRMNTPFTDLHYYILRSFAKIDTAIWGALSKKQNFNERSMFPKKG